MNSRASQEQRLFRRSSDCAMLGGVCAGLSDYFGFNLKAIRLLAIIGFILNPLLAFVAYIAAVMLFPAARTRIGNDRKEQKFRRRVRSSPGQAMNDVRGRFHALDRRLARLEKYVTSGRYNLDREFRDLERDAPKGGRQ